MQYGLEFVHKSNNSNLIVFVHGLVGGKHTWIRKDNQNTICNYLYGSQSIKNNFDIAVFSYFTKFTEFFIKMLYYLKYFFIKNAKFHKNLNLDDIADVLKSELCLSGYSTIIIIAHSMGGIISKKVILKIQDEINKSGQNNINKLPSIPLFVSLAVPHMGAELAILGRIIFKSKQIKGITPLNQRLITLNEEWRTKDIKYLPITLYVRAVEDNIVDKISAQPYEASNPKIQIEHSQGDHSSIVCISDNNNVVLKAILNNLQTIITNDIKLEIDKPKKIAYIKESIINKLKKLKPLQSITVFLLICFFISSHIISNTYPRSISKNKIVNLLDVKFYLAYKSKDSIYTINDYEDKKYNSLKFKSEDYFIGNYFSKKRKLLDIAEIKIRAIQENENRLRLIFHTKIKDTTNYAAFIVTLDENKGLMHYPNLENNNNWILYDEGGKNELISRKKINESNEIFLNLNVK